LPQEEKREGSTRQCSESEPADSLGEKSNTIGGWLRWLTLLIDKRMKTHEQQIADILECWAKATSEDRKEEILASHDEAAVIYDVLPPLCYNGTKEYGQSWEEWQPHFEIPSLFEIQDMKIHAGETHAFCHGFIRCGGKLPNGEIVEDFVRATFCLMRHGGEWRILHQHISMPLNQA
jgi:ketosteroid isomerase-like protein